ncbi:LytR/AlgR family response regulator transcription factor [Lutibacter sp.]
MNKIKIHIVEDEPLIAETIKTILEKAGYVVTGISMRGKEAIFDIETAQPNMVLADIILKGEMDGIEMIQQLQKRLSIPFIFLTSMSDEETINRVKKTNPSGFIVKPFNEHTLLTNIELALYKHKLEKPTISVNTESDSFFIKNKGELIKIKQNNILFFEAYDNYCNLYTEERKYLITHSLKSIEEKLPATTFLKVHRSFIINVSKIDSIQEGYVFMSNHKVSVSKTYKDALMKKLHLL